MRTGWFRSFVAMASMISLTACTVWRPYTPSSTDLLPVELRLKMRTGEMMEMRLPSMDGDSAIVGGVRGESRRFPLADVESLESRQTDTGRSLLVVLAVSTVALGLVASLAMRDMKVRIPLDISQ